MSSSVQRRSLSWVSFPGSSKLSRPQEWPSKVGGKQWDQVISEMALHQELGAERALVELGQRSQPLHTGPLGHSPGVSTFLFLLVSLEIPT